MMWGNLSFLNILEYLIKSFLPAGIETVDSPVISLHTGSEAPVGAAMWNRVPLRHGGRLRSRV